jgi:predicted GIY-YIG superfamily endonuclease
MRKNLQLQQDQMRKRQEQERKRQLPRAPSANPTSPGPLEYRPVNYAVPVNYTDAAVVEWQLNLHLYYQPTMSGGGVYLLVEDGQYYIGQTTDVPARFASHWRNPVSCKFKAPRCARLAVIRTKALSWDRRARLRLNAEARFIAAALAMGLPLTNTLSPFKRDKLLAQFPDISRERDRIAQALRLLEGRVKEATLSGTTE